MRKRIYLWEKAPFIRLLLALVIGIILQWFSQFDPAIWYIVFAIGALTTVCFFYFPLFKRYYWGFLNGIAILLPFTALGALLVWHNDIRHSKNWIGHQKIDNASIVVTLTETPVEKIKSIKANADISYLVTSEKSIPVKGKIILYFKKDSLLPRLENGSQIIFKNPLQGIRNSGNPGGFDYERYSLFQGITHQLYLQREEFIVLHETNKRWLPALLDKIRQRVLGVLRANIKGEKERGLAEALLIGYKHDLDKTLVQSYSNTGVVHIIAISGLHLGLVYWLLIGILKPMQHHKYGKWARPLIIISGLWLFSLLAGAQPSILRSAVMFTCIVLGESLTKRTSIYNTLALSAFLLLCYNPYWLWDVGFQLSYSAVLSIVIFMRPIYDWFYIKNKLLDFLWKINAVTIAAQLLTLPVSIYHFQQLPTLFLFTNFVSVPLSSIILMGEIFLCLTSFITPVALLVGKFLGWLIWLMNSYIEKIETVYFSVWDELQVNILQVLFLFVFITGASYWLLEKVKAGLLIGALALSAFFISRSYSFWQASKQQKVIVYNVANHQAIDFIEGRQFVFKGDENLLKNEFARNFHLKPSRILQRVQHTDSLKSLLKNEHFISFCHKNFLVADSSFSFVPLSTRHPVDLLIISHNPKLYISHLTQSFDIQRVVFDGSTPAWKIKYWKKDCDSLHIPYHDVREKGAFVMNLN